MRLVILTAVLTIAFAATACSGDDSPEVSPFPTLAGTPIPTAVIEPSPTPVCDAPAAGELPASFPADVPVPPGAVAEQIATAPHLAVVFRVEPPAAAQQQPYAVVGSAMLDQLQANGWSVKLNERADGVDWDFTKPDGRRGHFNSLPYIGCDALVRLTIDLFWITP